MWPRKLPQEVTSNPFRNSECKVYKKLEQNLDDSFVVFYSRPWLGLTQYGEEKDGECDFLVAHRDLGILVLEVKGGGIAYDSETEKWTSTDRNGFKHNIKNPIIQATSSKYQIIKKLNNSDLWKPRFINAKHGIIFPDSESPEEDLGANITLNICCFIDDFEVDLHDWILNRLSENTADSFRIKPLGDDGLKALERLLAYPFQLHAPIGTILSEDDKAISTLTQQQFHILESIQEIPRAIISGGAGTGKTILAIEEAIRNADSGKNVLLTCYNRPLAEFLTHRLHNWKNITVDNFHGLCFRLAKEVGIHIPAIQDQKKLFREIYPEILQRSLTALPEYRFNEIIIDEGQDFIPLWIPALEKAFDSESDKLLRVFIDSNQSVYGTIPELPLESKPVPIRLTQNMRNTKRIHSVVQNYYSGYAISPAGPEGVPVEWIPADSVREIGLKTEEKIHQLVSDERLDPSDIAVLTVNDRVLTEISPENILSGYACQRADDDYADQIVLDTVRRFKGLERKTVILVVTPELLENRELIYVGVSRARTQLIVIGDTEVLKLSTINRNM